MGYHDNYNRTTIATFITNTIATIIATTIATITITNTISSIGYSHR